TLRLPPCLAKHYACLSAPFQEHQETESMLKSIIAKPDAAVAGSARRVKKAASVRWALASLSLSMLLSSLGTSIANVGLPTLAQAFNASFQEVQWIVRAYLLPN